MASKSSYMLKRDKDESKRLDFQHEFMRALGHGNILHPSIPRQDVCAVADMGTGTGIWLNDIAEELRAYEKHGENDANLHLVGFDISAEQFPPGDDQLSEVEFVVHDMTIPFPEQYHGRFDLVNMRFLVYALNEVYLQRVVENVAEILSKDSFPPLLGETNGNVVYLQDQAATCSGRKLTSLMFGLHHPSRSPETPSSV